MTHKISHPKVSAKTDSVDTSLVLPSDWNNNHAISWGYATPNKNTISVSDADTLGDSNWEYVKLSMHFDGVDNSTSIIDSSTITKTVTLYGNAKIRTNADTINPKYGTGKLYFDGTNSYAQVTAHSDFTIGTNVFTFDFWIRPSLSSYQDLIDMRPTSTSGAYIFLGLSSAGVLNLYVSGADRIVTASSTVVANVWQHISLNRTGGVTTLYVDGVSEGSWADTTTYLVNNNYGMRIGYNSYAVSEFYSGYIDEFQFLNGYCRRTEAFTPPTAPNYDSLPSLTLDSTKNYQSAGPILIDTVDVLVPSGSNWVIV